MNKGLLIALAVVIIGGALYFAFAHNGMENNPVDGMMNGMEDQTGQDDQDGTGNAMNNGGDSSGSLDTEPENSVTIAETETGNAVTIERAYLHEDGYVVIHKVDSNGDSSVIGHSDLLTAGEHNAIRIQTDTVVAEEETIVAVLHRDDGDGEFEFPDSDPYMSGAGGATIVTDVDVVEVPANEEDAELQEQVQMYLESQASA